MHIVIDRNVWISALVFGGNPRKVLEQCLHDGTHIVLSEEILTEVRRTLKKKFPQFLVDFEALLVALDSYTIKVRLGGVEVTVCRDPDDNKVLETAFIGHAIWLVSGDKDLLDLKSYEGIRVVSPGDYLAHL